MRILWLRAKVWVLRLLWKAYCSYRRIQTYFEIRQWEREFWYGKRSWKKPVGILRSDEIER